MSAYSPPWMTPDLVLFGDAIRRFFDNEVIPHEDRWRAQRHPDREIWRKAGEIGMLCASIPEEYGGGGGSFLHEAVICIEQNRALSNSFSLNVHSGILAHYILRYGSESQKRHWLPKMATGEMVGAIAMTEPSAGSDLQSIRTSAVRPTTTQVQYSQSINLRNSAAIRKPERFRVLRPGQSASCLYAL